MNYVIKQKNGTSEFHIFQYLNREPEEGEVKKLETSMCGKAGRAESPLIVRTATSERELRIICAEIGRKICADCIKHLYG